MVDTEPDACWTNYFARSDIVLLCDSENMKIGSQMYPAPAELTIPKQVKRTLPALIVIVLFIAFLSCGGSMNNANFFPSRPEKFPRKIWQTWKVNPFGFEGKDSAVASTWTAKNPDFRYEVLTDQNDLAYVETHFGPTGLNRPDIVYIYRELTVRIVKADFLRYLIMYVEGGIYTDIDVEALRPVSRFLPDRYNERDIDMVIGVEIDQPEFRDHPILGKKCESFCQWTFMCKPRLPVMLRLVEDIMQWLKEVAMAQKVAISQIQLDFDEVISGTGPSAFTKAVLADMSEREGRVITWDTFHNLGESKLISGTLVLTVEAFAAGQGHSDSGNHNAKQALVKHHYHASKWPTSHPRYKHPIHGEVERCNWDADCVRTWDNDKAAFEALPQEEQARQISIKQANEAMLQAQGPSEM